MARVVGHLDLDYFYAQVEEVENPSLRDRPVLVCVFSGRTPDSGVVSTSNYIARKFGVNSGMPIAVAKRILQDKDPVLVRMVLSKYEAISDRVMELVKSEVDVFEQTGIDEGFFDLTKSTGGDFNSATKKARWIGETILRNEHLTCSIGLGRSKAVAKLCSDSAKPAGLKVVQPEETEDFMRDMDVSRLYGIGPRTTEVLGRLGIRKAADLAKADVFMLERSFGRRLSAYLHDAANGTDSDQVKEIQVPSQFSRIVTLKWNTTDPVVVMEQLADAKEDLKNKLVAQHAFFRTISAIAIFADLSTKTRSKTYETPVKDLTMVHEDILELFSQLSETSDKEFRRTGIRVSDLVVSQDQSSLTDYIEQP